MAYNPNCHLGARYRCPVCQECYPCDHKLIEHQGMCYWECKDGQLHRTDQFGRAILDHPRSKSLRNAHM